MFKIKNQKFSMVAGSVAEIKTFEKNGRSGSVITFKEGNKEAKVFFNNSGTVDFTSRLEKAKITKGKKILCFCFAPNEGNEDIYTGLDFNYPGRTLELKDEESTVNVFFGHIGNLKDGKSGQSICSGAIDKYVDGQTETEWLTFSFWDNEKGAQNATNARKLLAKGDTVAIVYGEVRTLDNGMKCTNARRFSKIF